MPVIAHSAFYFADDKDVLDLLDSAKKRLTQPVLRDFLLKRGIVVSQAETREELVDFISTMHLDWFDLSELIQKSEIGDRAEKVTSVSLPAAASKEQMTAAVNAVKAGRSASRGEVFKVVTRADGGVDVHVEYSEIDRSKNRLAQRRKREGTVSLVNKGEAFAMRHEANQRLKSVAKDIIEALEKETAKELEPKVITFASIKSSDVRTQFFIDMVEGIDGMDLVDVTWVAVHRAPATDDSPDAEVDGVDIGEAEDDGDVEDAGLAMDSDATSMAGVVRDVVLRGDTLLTSKEYQSLRKDFFMCGIVWDAEETKDDGVRVRFEAEFENRGLASGLKYHVRGVFNRSAKDDADFNKTHRPCTPAEQQQYLSMLEDAAGRAYASAGGAAAETVEDDTHEEEVPSLMEDECTESGA